jgi:hypothetical protein
MVTLFHVGSFWTVAFPTVSLTPWGWLGSDFFIRG